MCKEFKSLPGTQEALYGAVFGDDGATADGVP